MNIESLVLLISRIVSFQISVVVVVPYATFTYGALLPSQEIGRPNLGSIMSYVGLYLGLYNYIQLQIPVLHKILVGGEYKIQFWIKIRLSLS